MQAAIAQAAATLVDAHLHPLYNYARWVEVRSNTVMALHLLADT